MGILSSSTRFTTVVIVVYIIPYVLTSILYNNCDVLITSTPMMYLVNYDVSSIKYHVELSK